MPWSADQLLTAFLRQQNPRNILAADATLWAIRFLRYQFHALSISRYIDFIRY